MPANDVITCAAAVVFLAIAIIAAIKRGEGPLTRPLGLMALLLFAYCVADVASAISGRPQLWGSLAYAAASFSAAFAMSLVAGFLGMRLRLRHITVPLYIYFGLLGAYCLAMVALGDSLHEPVWAAAMLTGIAAGAATLGYRLWKHARQSPPIERARCHLLGAAFVLGFGGVATDLAVMTGAPLPRLAALGLALTAIVLAAMVLWAHQLFLRVTRVWGLVAILVAMAGVTGQLLVVRLAAGQTALVLFGTMIVLGLVGVALWPLVQHFILRRARRQYHATLGRWSDRVRHNILNPLAAMKGAAEVVLEDHARGRPINQAHLRLIVDKVGQVASLIHNFERLARGEPHRQSLDLNAMLADVGQSYEAATGQPITFELEEALPEILADHDLLVAAFENLVHNAADAMPEGGRLTVRTKSVSTPLGQRVVVSVVDQGHGIDPRHLEDIFAPDFSTRGGPGRGLGLAYVHEVVAAHGGTIWPRSELGRGTTMRVELPR